MVRPTKYVARGIYRLSIQSAGGLPGGAPADHDHEATEVSYDNAASGLAAVEVQAALDELAAGIGWEVSTVGTLSAGGSPQTVINDEAHNSFPGLVRLDPERVLAVYRRGTTHLFGGEIYGQIGVLNAARTAVSSWDPGFLIYTNDLDVRCEDAVSIVENQLVIAARLYDGTNNDDPFIIICDDAPSDFTDASTWGSPIAIPLTTGTVQNYSQGHVQKLANGTYILGVGWQGAGTHTVGVAKWSAALNNPAAATFVTVASGANDYAEIAIAETSAANIRAMVRSVTAVSTYTATSTDSGATWSAVASAHDGYGYPMFRLLLSGIYLTVYRDSPNGDNAWRQTTTPGGSWGTETILDATGTRSAYATLVQLTPAATLCIYAIEYSSDGSTGGADIFAQVFTDSSAFTPGPGAISPLTTKGDLWGYDTADNRIPVGTDGTGLVADSAQALGVRWGALAGELLISDTPSTPLIFGDLIQNEAEDDLVYADP